MTRIDPSYRTAAIALAALLLCGPAQPARAATQDAPAAPAAAGETAAPQAAAARERFLRELADIELILDVEGDVETARAALLLVTVDITRTLAVAEAAELLERAAALRARLDAARPVAEATDLVGTVLQAVDKNNMATLEQLGSRAVDVIEAELREPEAPPEPGAKAGPTRNDLLFAMIRLDPHRTYALVSELEQAGRPFPSEMLFDLMVRGEVLTAWVFVPGRPPGLAEPGWLDVFARMLASRDFVSRSNTWSRVGACLAALVSHDAITPEIVEALSAYTLPTDATFMRNCVLTSLSSQVQFASTKPLLDVLARHPDERVRGGAAVLLSGYDDSEVLRTLVDDPSTEVRLAVARLLRPKNVTRVRWLDRQGRSEEYRVGTDPVVDDQARQIMARLLADEDPSVREAAIASASTFDVPLDVSAYAPLVDDPDPGVRVMLATFLPAAMPGAEDLLLQLARSGDVVALEALARRLQSRPSDARQDLLMGDNLPRFLPVLSAVSASSSANESYVNRAWGDIIDQPDGSLLLLQEAERAGNDALVDRVVRGWRSRPPAETVRQVVELQSSVLADLLPRIERSVRSVFAILVGEAAKSASEGAVAAMAALAEDEQLDPYVRLSAVSVVVARGRDGWEERLLALLSSEAVRGWTPERDASLLRDVSRRLPPGDRNRVLLRIMDECGLPDALLLPLVYDFDAYAPHGEALSVAVLQRWHDDATGPTEEALYPAIERAGSMAGRIDPALVIGTVHSPRPGIAARAVQAMGRLRDPVFLPVLRECLERNWLSENDQGDLAGYAILALTGYMSDEAASILLEGAASAPYASLRKDCMEGVKAIHEYQEARAEWERRAGTRATRDDAVLALVRMLDDEDATIRAECLRGLGLLGAVEHLPRVILALKDADAAVREAAREALGRLNALESPEGVPAGEPASAPASADGGDAADVEGAEDGSDG